MTGPIKFRGRLPGGKYVYGDLVQWGGFEDPRICSWDNGVIYDIDVESVAQLVGYDSKGKEVYEGDVMTTEDGKPFIAMLKPHGCTFREENGRRDYSSLTFELAGRNYINKFTVKEARL